MPRIVVTVHRKARELSNSPACNRSALPQVCASWTAGYGVSMSVGQIAKQWGAAELSRIFCSQKGQNGMTLLEIIFVMVMMGIVWGVVITSSKPAKETVLTSEAEALRGHIQYAQTRALNTHCDYHWGIQFLQSTNEWKVFTSNPDITARLPGEKTDPDAPDPVDTHRMNIGVTFISAPDYIFFNCWGEPVNVSNEIETTDQDIVLGASGSTLQIQMRIQAQTGRVVTL